jgi:L-cysteine desulfidase
MCLAVARATEELGQMPERIEVIVSPNVYKNGVNVGVPGTGKRVCLAKTSAAFVPMAFYDSGCTLVVMM